MALPVAAVVGVGEGLGLAVASRFAKEGFHVALLARSKEKLDVFEKQIKEEGHFATSFPCDSTNEEQVVSVFTSIKKNLGPPQVLVYNAGAYHQAGILNIKPKLFEDSFKVGCFGGFLAAQQVLPSMVEKGEGTILFTGATASLRGAANFSCLAVGKFAQRALAQSMAREFGPKGIHIAHIIIDGIIYEPRTREWFPDKPADFFLHPDQIANTYWHLHTQNRTAWTHELELRPAGEKW